MAGSTPILGFPYPDPSDLVANYPTLGQDLAEDIEANIIPSLGLVNAGGTALTGAGTITVNLSNKNFIHVYVQGASSASATSIIYVRLNADGGSNYPATIFSRDNTTLTTTVVSNDGVWLARMGDLASTTISAHITFVGTNGTGAKPFTFCGVSPGSNTNISNNGNGIWTGSARVTSVSLISSLGNFDAGTLWVYAG